MAIALVGTALVGAACSSGKADKARPNQGAAKASTSVIYGVSVFPQAVPDAGSTVAGREVYSIQGKSPEAVVSFYYRGLGVAGSPDQLESCAENESIDGSPPFELAWRVPDTNDFLIVQVESAGATDQPGSILTIIDDKANATRTCTTE